MGWFVRVGVVSWLLKTCLWLVELIGESDVTCRMLGARKRKRTLK